MEGLSRQKLKVVMLALVGRVDPPLRRRGPGEPPQVLAIRKGSSGVSPRASSGPRLVGACGSPVQYPRKSWKAIGNDKSAPALQEAVKQDLGDVTFREASN